MSSQNQWENVFACPYCFSGVREEWPACCGEYGHAEWMFMNEDGETLTKDEYEALDLKMEVANEAGR